MRAGREADRETFLAVALISALEDAVTDWAAVGPVKTSEDSPHGGKDAEATLTILRAAGPVPAVSKHRVSPQTIAAGYDVLMKNSDLDYVNDALRGRLMQARARNDVESFAVGRLDEDTLVQLGLFGRVVF